MKDRSFWLVIGAAIIGFAIAGNAGSIVLGLVAIMITPKQQG
jgi:hypothetical protein